jgi:hypothetical protein
MSNTVFVVKNQHGQYLSKQQEWLDGTDNQSLYRTRHRDEAINTVFEVSSRDIYLRAESVVCELDAKGNPALATAEKQTAVPTVTTELEEADIDEESAPIENNVADSDETADQNNFEQQNDPEPESLSEPHSLEQQDQP